MSSVAEIICGLGVVLVPLLPSKADKSSTFYTIRLQQDSECQLMKLDMGVGLQRLVCIYDLAVNYRKMEEK